MSNNDMSDSMEVEDTNIQENEAGIICRRSERRKRCPYNWLIYNYSIGIRYGRRKPRKSCSVLYLPNEIIVKIFSYVPKNELLEVRQVCRRFNELSSSSPLWKNLNIDESISPNGAKTLLTMGGQYCQQLKFKNRIDTNNLLDCASKVTKNLQNIEIINCRGSKTCHYLRSLNLCNFISRAKKLQFFTICCTRFKSCRFFKLLARKRPENRDPKFRIPIIYTGPVNSKQMKIHFLSAFEDIIFSEDNKKGNLELHQMFNNPGIGFLKGKMISSSNEKPAIMYEIEWTDY